MALSGNVLPMANLQTTFGSLESDKRFKKLERSLKLALLKKEHSNCMHSGKTISPCSISSINGLDSTYTASLHKISIVGSEVLASSNNLRDILPRKKILSNRQEMIPTSSVKDYNVKQDKHTDQSIMPPPMGTKVHRVSTKPQKSFSDVSTNTDIDMDHLHSFVTSVSSFNNPPRVDRIFIKWKVMLNDEYDLIIKGTLDCGKAVRSKPVIRRYTATCVESKFRHKYNLQGNIVDERNELPDYVYGKFYNGFPDDWENVYQIWKTYISRGSPVMFRWPTAIADSDDDLKSELTDLTNTYLRRNSTIPTMTSYKNECVRPESSNVKTFPEERNICYNNYPTRNFQKPDGENCSSVKSVICVTEKDTTPIVQTRNVKLTNEQDERNIRINPVSSPRRANTSCSLASILQEDKLKLIIDNLADKNCSSEYINKVIEMFDCVNYVLSYRTPSERKCDSEVSQSYKSEVIPLEQIAHNNNHISIKNPKNGTMETNSYIQSTDLGYGTIRNDSNPTQLSNPTHSIQSRYNNNKDLDESESETYAGIPKISIERVLKMRENASGTVSVRKRKTRKKTVHLSTPNYITNQQYNGEESDRVRTTIPIIHSGQNPLLNGSCVSITEDEIEALNTRKCQKTVTQELQEMAVSSYPRSNFNMYGESQPTAFTQKKQLLDPFDAQNVDRNVFVKEQKVPHKVREDARKQFIADVDYADNSNIDDVVINTNEQNKQKSEIQNRNMMKIHANSDQSIVISSESNSNLPRKGSVARELHQKFVEQPRSEIPMTRTKPIIVSSVPINLNLKISSKGSKSRWKRSNSDVSLSENEENQCTNIPPMEETRKKPPVKTSIAMKTAIITNDCNSTVDNTKQDCPKTSGRNELDHINSANSLKPTTSPVTRQLRSSKLIGKNNPKALTAWMPKLIHYTESKSELALTFQGKLLNETGHIVNRKFTTDVILRRLSTRLIETVNHEFYQLRGNLSDNKHILPKEIIRLCRNGCPAQIEQFCLIWKTLQHEISQDTSMDSLSVPISTRGRKMLPPLCYWTGERVTSKNNIPVYNSGNLRESLLISPTENSEQNSEERKRQEANTSKEKGTNKQKVSPESNKISGTNRNEIAVLEKTRSPTKSKTTVMHDTKTEDMKESRKSMVNNRQVSQRLTFSSTDSNEEEKVSPRKQHARKPDTNALHCIIPKKRLRREKIWSSNLEAIKSKQDTAHCSPTKKSNNKMICTYYKDISLAEDLSSENSAWPA